MVHTDASDRRQRRRQRSLDAWLDAALDVVAEVGLSGLTIKGLAQRVDRSVGAIYRYFPSKNALIVAMGARVLGALGERLEAVPGDDPLARVRAMADEYIAFATDEPARFALIQSLVGEPRQLLDGEDAAAVADAMRALLARVAVQLHAAVEAGQLAAGDPAERTLHLWAGLQGTLQLRKFGRFEPRMADLAPIARNLVSALLRGWSLEDRP